ncbi:hypothetical protein ACQP1O_17420 [Nocardia sp. CA-151230]|uniref:hypothetical protein n=1 Tax=Nocardia sp. CA-151230 TaxID=3239982 RepID=UPI003D8FF790
MNLDGGPSELDAETAKTDVMIGLDSHPWPFRTTRYAADECVGGRAASSNGEIGGAIPGLLSRML